MRAMAPLKSSFLLGLLIFATCRAAKPNITIAEKVVKLYEDVMSPTVLTTVQCEDPIDKTDPVAFGAIKPTTNCEKCFLVLPVDLALGEYEIKFFPSVATLDFNTCPEYNLTLTCSNNVDPDTSDTLYIRLYPNSPPEFTLGLAINFVLTNTKSYTANQLIYQVEATDPDNDPIYYTMKTTPASSSFAIGYSKSRDDVA
uniref:Cadherin domain-containing protein n=1 Tax=Biomphalaria glabrata TaxID=6526 RepID=A0A2C9LLS9_BIOGL